MQDYALSTSSYLKYIITTSLHPSTTKIISAFFLFIYGFFFDVTQSHAHVALFFLVILDFITGVYAARFKKEKIKSAKIRHTAIKMTAYFTMIAGAHLAESGLHHVLSFLDETVLAFLLVTELISLLENMGKMGFDTPKGLIDKLVDYKNKQ